MKVLYIGDVVGKSGLKFLEIMLPRLRQEYAPNLVFINGENVSNGKGLSLKDYKKIMSLNISGMSMGNHTFRNQEINSFINEAKIARPLNMKDVLGKGFIDIEYNGKIVTIVSLIGTYNMPNSEKFNNPFDEIISFVNNHHSDYLIVDFHAESTSEKIAMGYLLDGKADAVVGTHTHVQTNDARILEKGTLYITDLGMTGPRNGVLGVKKEIIINRFLKNDLHPFELDDSPKQQLNGVLLDFSVKKNIKIIHFEG